MNKLANIFAVVLIATVAIFAQIPTNGLVCFFPFTGNYKDACGNIVLDTSKPAAAVPVADRNGTANAADTFNGSNTRFSSTGTSKLPSGSSDITICAWLKWNSSGQPAVIASWGTDTLNQNKEIVFYCASTPSTAFLGITNGIDSVTLKMPTNTTKTWFYAAVVVKSGTVQLFVNTATEAAKPMIFNIQAGGPLGLCTDMRTATVGVSNLGGCLDDIAIYNRALTSEEINYVRTSKSTLNAAPIITSKAVTEAEALNSYTYSVTTTDADNQTITLSLAVKPAGMVISGNKITWTPTNEQAGKNAVSIVAKDALGDSSVQTFEINVEPTTGISHSIVPVITKQQHGNVFYLPNGRVCQKNLTRGLVVSTHMKRIVVR